ncbi:Uncharacterised protein [Mycobacterium tuberculosis]|nr:Uncharacterised protein [Mycobacterium tuberculosis]
MPHPTLPNPTLPPPRLLNPTFGPTIPTAELKPEIRLLAMLPSNRPNSPTPRPGTAKPLKGSDVVVVEFPEPGSVMIGMLMGPTGIVTSTFSGIAGSTVAGMKTASSRLMDTSIGRISCRIIDFTVDAGEPKEKLSGMDSLTVGNGILSPAMVMGIELPGITIGFSSMPSLKSNKKRV